MLALPKSFGIETVCTFVCNLSLRFLNHSFRFGHKRMTVTIKNGKVITYKYLTWKVGIGLRLEVKE